MSAPPFAVPPLSPRAAFFVDIDGTIVDIAPLPEAVVVTPQTRRVVERLSAITGGALALVSGRAIASIDRLFAPLVLPCAGEHGFERRDARGVLHHQPAPVDLLRSKAAALEHLVAQNPGLLIEEKGASMAVHYRLAPALAHVVEAAVTAVAAELGDAFELQHGKLVVELKPRGWNKGRALAAFMDEPPFAGRTAVAIGDDLTDEHLFAAANALGGVSIKVGAGPTLAQHQLPDPQAVRDLLESYVEEPA